MKASRRAWSVAKALVAVNPCIMPAGSEIGMVRQALPEVVKLQPTGVYREVIYSNDKVHMDFIRELGTLVAAPAETHVFFFVPKCCGMRSSRLLPYTWKTKVQEKDCAACALRRACSEGV